MKSKNDEATQRVLLLLKIDANNLYMRISERKSEYLEIFALRRTRVHFPMIFKNKYEAITISELAHCSTELIASLDQFYSRAEEMSWYLFQTQDMPSTVLNYMDRSIKKLGSHLQSLNLFLDSELGIENAQIEIPKDGFLEEVVEGDPFAEDDLDVTPEEQ